MYGCRQFQSQVQGEAGLVTFLKKEKSLFFTGFQWGWLRLWRSCFLWRRTMERTEEYSSPYCRLWVDHGYRCPQIWACLHEYGQYPWENKGKLGKWLIRQIEENVKGFISHTMGATRRYRDHSLKIDLISMTNVKTGLENSLWELKAL